MRAVERGEIGAALGALLTALLVSAAPVGEARAEDASITLRARPNACVVLHRGQSCERRIEFTWHTPLPRRYCLHGERADAPLLCWRGDELGRHVHAFDSTRTERFVIRGEVESRTLATVRVKVEWVYRSNRRGSSAWRLF